MPLNLASPGIVVREVDLTVGRVDTASDKVGALVGPFAKGAVDLPILVETEQDLLDNFGKPYSADKHYEYWMTASSYLAYGGPLRVVRADDDDLKNAFAGSASDIKIKSTEHYNDLGYDGSVISGNDRKEIHGKMKEYFEKNGKTKDNKPKLNFPVTILSMDDNKNVIEKKIETHEVMKEVMAYCKGGKDDKGDDKKKD